MRFTKMIVFGFGTAAVAAVIRHRRTFATGDPGPDFRDPVQRLDGSLPFEDEDDEAGQDEHATPVGVADVGDIGDLYGVHTPHAVERNHRDNDAAFAEGENWLESLEVDAVEYGAEPERPLEIVDDADIDAKPHATDTRDKPVADRGSGGRAGM